jgi:4-amino-4-deoxy-L-arabinose transferase-like glycosyltransferase
MDRPSIGAVVLLALAFGLGLNAKYAMAYFVPCAVLAVLWTGRTRTRPSSLLPLAAALLGGLALLIPNLLWNADNGFATFAHTADNAGWRGIPFHPGKAAEFLLTQFGVFGPVLFGVLIAALVRAVRGEARLSDADRLMLAFSLPILAAVTAQGFLSHALANWAAPAYVTAAVFVTAELVRRDAWGWLRGSLALGAAIQVLIAAASIGAGHFTLPRAGDPFARTLGQRGLADAVRSALDAERAHGVPIAGVVTDARAVTAGLLYYGQDLPVPVWAWRAGPRPQNHFEMVRGFPEQVGGAALLVTLSADPRAITSRFGSVTPLGARAVPAGDFTTRTVHFFRLASYKGASS